MIWYLIVLGIMDFWKRKVPVLLLLAGGIVFSGMGIKRCIQGEMLWQECVWGMIPGMVLLLVAGITKKAGYGDGIVLVQMGIYLGCERVLLLFCFSLLLLSGSCMVLLLLRKVNKNTRMPYLSFLAITYFVGMLGGG